MANLTTQERIDLIKSISEEIVGEDELTSVLESNQPLVTYDGFEPSGQMHIAQGIQRAINVNKMIKAGFTFKMLVADWFGYLNNKMGGNIEKIQVVGNYFIELWKASGMNLNGVEFVWTSEMVKDPKYWELVMRVAKANSLKRILKTTQIMGRSENDDLSAAQIFYPCMQAADVFILGAQVTQLGMDQRKVNMLAREVGVELGFFKPVVVSHHMLMGLGAPNSKTVTNFVSFTDDNKFIELDAISLTLQSYDYNSRSATVLVTNKFTDQSNNLIIKDSEINQKTLSGATINKIDFREDFTLGIQISFDPRNPADKAIDQKMSKSVPDSAIFMTDSYEDIKRKITKAYCMDGSIKDNPILEYCKYIIFEAIHLKGQEDLLKDGFVIDRPEKWGGKVIFKTYKDLESAFEKNEVSSIDLKSAVIEYVNKLIEPVRNHFINDSNAKEILKKVQSYSITR